MTNTDEPRTDGSGTVEPASISESASVAESESGNGPASVAEPASPVEDAGEGLPGRVPTGRRIFVQLHRGAVVFFAIFGAYLISIYLDLWVNMGFTLLLDHAPAFLMKFVVVPLALEAGMGLAGLAILYLVGRFVELALWPTLVTFWLGLHLVDGLMKWLLGQFEWGYGEPRVLLLRLPGLVLFFLISVRLFRLALKREPS